MTKSMNAGAQRHAPDTIWHKSGEPLRAAPLPAPVRPDLSLVATPPADLSDTPPRAAGPVLAGLQRWTDRAIESLSLVSTAPVLDVRDFDWTAPLRGHWRAVREEALAVIADRQPTMLWRGGMAVPAAVGRCPQTAALLADIPALDSATFAVLPAATHCPTRRGPTRALITCDLALSVPRCGDVRMRIHDRIVRWAEGETLMYDDSVPHECWNEAAAPRIVLRVRVARPVRRPGDWLRRVILRGLRSSAGA